MKDNIADIHDRVARHDLRYDAVPCTYFEGFILGNGELGAVLWLEEDCMVLSLDKADVWERRADQSLEPGMDYRTALQQVRDGSFDPSCRVFDPVRPPDRVWGNKLPIGRVEWPLGQTPTALEGKIALYEAAFSLELQLEQGALTVWGYLHACENIVEIEMEAHGKIFRCPLAASPAAWTSAARRSCKYGIIPRPSTAAKGLIATWCRDTAATRSTRYSSASAARRATALATLSQ